MKGLLGTGYKNAAAQVLRQTSLLLPWDVLERTRAGKEDGAEAAAMRKEKNTSGRPFLLFGHEDWGTTKPQNTGSCEQEGSTSRLEPLTLRG